MGEMSFEVEGLGSPVVETAGTHTRLRSDIVLFHIHQRPALCQEGCGRFSLYFPSLAWVLRVSWGWGDC